MNQDQLMRRNILISTVCMVALLAASSAVSAQSNREMLLFEVNGNEYAKRNYSQEGKLKGWQKMHVGTLQKAKDAYQLPVKIYSYSADSTLQDSTKTMYVCDPDDRKVLLNILPFTDHTDQSTIKVKLLDTNAIYPVNPKTGWTMESIRFKLDLDSGIIGFFGGDSRIKMFNRQVVTNDTLDATRYQINSDVSIGAYVMGIQVKSIRFDVKEIVHAEARIVWQRFDQEGEGYFIINLVHSSDITTTQNKKRTE